MSSFGLIEKIWSCLVLIKLYCTVWWILAMGLADLWGIANLHCRKVESTKWLKHKLSHDRRPIVWTNKRQIWVSFSFEVHRGYISPRLKTNKDLNNLCCCFLKSWLLNSMTLITLNTRLWEGCSSKFKKRWWCSWNSNWYNSIITFCWWRKFCLKQSSLACVSLAR